MPLTSQIQSFYIKKFAGQNTKVEEQELPIEQAIKAQNCEFEPELGSISKRSPLAYYNTSTLGANPILSMYRFYKSDGTIKLVTSYDSTIKVGTDASGAFTSIRTGMTAGKRHSFVTYKDILIGSNGYDNPWCYDGADNVTWELGSAKAVLTAGGTNLDSGAAYYYAVTINADAFICGAVSNTVTTDAGNRKVTLSNIPLGPAGTTNRKIFRTEGDGSTLKLLATIADNTTVTYVDDIADGSLSDTMGAVTDDMPLGNLLNIHRERLFISGDPSNPNRIYYSNPYLPHYIAQTTDVDYMEIEKDDNDEIVGIPMQLGILLCIKKNTIRKVHVTTPVSGYSPSTWYADDPIAFIGSPAKWSIIQTPYGVVFQGWDHWYLFNGVKAEPIIDQFDTDDILSARYAETACHFNKGILYIAYTDATDANQYHDRVARYNFKRQTLAVDLLNVASFTSFTGDDESGETYYGDSVNGFVYMARKANLSIRYRTKTQLETGTTDDIVISGEEDAPQMEIARDDIIDDLTGIIDDLVGTINMGDTDGTVTFPSIEVNAGTLGKMYWNVREHNDADTVYAHTRVGADKAACEAAGWSAALTLSGQDITSTANLWIQVKFEFTANSTAGSPVMYYADGFVWRFTYTRDYGTTTAEDSVEFTYRIGFRNLDSPAVDKVFKKLFSSHEGTAGDFEIRWYTENSSGTFTIPLSTYPANWSTFFPSNAFGKKIDIEWYKNDLEDFKVKELTGIYTPEPLII